MISKKSIFFYHIGFDFKKADAIRTVKFMKWMEDLGYTSYLITSNEKNIPDVLDKRLIIKLPHLFKPYAISSWIHSWFLFKFFFKKKKSVIFCFLTPTIPPISLLKILKNRHLSVFYDFQGIPQEIPSEMGEKLISYLYMGYINFINKIGGLISDYLTVHNIVLRTYINQIYNIPKEKIFCIPNFVTKKIDKKPLNLEIKDFINNRKSIIFIGGNQEWQGLPNLIKSIECTNNLSNICFIIIGPNINQIEKKSNRVLFLKYMEHELLLSILPNFDFGIIPRSNNLITSVASPTKFFEYLFSNLIILTTYVGEPGILVKKYKLGFILGNDFDEIYRHIDEMTNLEISEYKNRINLFSNNHFKEVSVLMKLSNLIDLVDRNQGKFKKK